MDTERRPSSRIVHLAQLIAGVLLFLLAGTVNKDAGGLSPDNHFVAVHIMMVVAAMAIMAYGFVKFFRIR